MEEEFDFEFIADVINPITDAYEDMDQFICASFLGNEVEIRFSSMEGIDTSLFPSRVYRNRSNQELFISINYIEGPVITPSVLEIKGGIEFDDKKESLDQNAIIMGGDMVRNIKSNSMGTASFFTKEMFIEIQGVKTCITKNALVSNNHVIGRSDAGLAGEKIYHKNTSIGKLHCSIPLRGTDIDVSTATISNMNNVKTWEIRSIGKLKNILLPRMNERVRKYGITTKLTSGKVIGITNIRTSDGNKFRGVFITSNGFGCPGDSGSTVVNANNDALGIHTWGDAIPCGQKPLGYFWSFLNPPRFRNKETNLVIVNSENIDYNDKTLG